MKPRSSPIARIVAASALALACVLAIVVIGSSVGGGSSGPGKGNHGGSSAHKAAKKKGHVPASYEVQSGDTLISIAHRTGVPVREIEALNPQVDPQILIAGEELKLR
jgi:LysM repeat protein